LVYQKVGPQKNVKKTLGGGGRISATTGESNNVVLKKRIDRGSRRVQNW